MLTGKIRSDIDRLWEKFWTGGITNPLTVIEQISYLMFARMLDMQEDMAERKATSLQKLGKGSGDFDRLFPNTPEGQLLRWKNFKQKGGKELHAHLKNNVFPYFAKLGKKSDEQDGLGGEGSAIQALGHIGEYMQDADLEIKNESVLVSAVEMVDDLPLTQSDVKGDIYEYLLSKLTTAGINGQFRTPRHIIRAMVEMLDPEVNDRICDPACGTAGFLSVAYEYLLEKYTSPEGIHTETVIDEKGQEQQVKIYSGDLLLEHRDHVDTDMFHGFDFDSTMLRIAAMNLVMHGIAEPDIHYQDTLSGRFSERYPEQSKDAFSMILANPPFKGSLDEEDVDDAILRMVKTKKTELLFVAQILRMLKNGGKTAIIVPDGVLFGSSKAHQQLRKHIVENNELQGVVSLPSGVFKPYAGVSTAILFITKGSVTDHVWFYDLQNDGFSLDDKRTIIKENDLEDLVASFKARDKNAAETEENDRIVTDEKKHFWVSKADIAANKYDLTINRYKEVVYEEEQYEPPKEILGKLVSLENEILADLKELEAML